MARGRPRGACVTPTAGSAAIKDDARAKRRIETSMGGLRLISSLMRAGASSSLPEWSLTPTRGWCNLAALNWSTSVADLGGRREGRLAAGGRGLLERVRELEQRRLAPRAADARRAARQSAHKSQRHRDVRIPPHRCRRRE